MRRRCLTPPHVDSSENAPLTQFPTTLIVPADIPVAPRLTIPAGTPVDLFLSLPAPNGLNLFNGVLVPQTVSTTITNPEQVVFGLAYQLEKSWTVFGDYQFTRWGKRFYVVNINFDNLLLTA